MWLEHKINSGSHQRFIFNVSDNQNGFKISFDSTVDGTGLDIVFVLCTYEDCNKLINWMTNKTKRKRDSQGRAVKNKEGYPIFVDVPRPKIREFFNLRTNMLNKTISLPTGTYTLLFDNTYSLATGKNLWSHIVETWDEENVREDLPTMQYLLEEIPPDVVTCMKDANDCYVAGHYNQCSVMLRKGIELAIKIKLLQSGLSQDQLLDKAENEIGLSTKIKFLKKEKLLTQKAISDMEKIKWFGDIGAHGTMRVAEQDIRDNVEPKVRSFLVALNLKT